MNLLQSTIQFEAPTNEEIIGFISYTRQKLCKGFIGGRIRYRNTAFFVHYSPDPEPKPMRIEWDSMDRIFIEIPKNN